MFRLAVEVLTDRPDITDSSTAASKIPARRLSRLHSPWWKQVLLFLATALEELVEDFVDLLLDNDDVSGSNSCLAQSMLTECAPTAQSADAEAPIPAYVQRAREATSAKLERMRPATLLARGLTHPSIELRNLVLSELRQFSTSPSQVADELLDRLGRTRSSGPIADGARAIESSWSAGRHLPWYSQLAAIESLGLLQHSSPSVISALVSIWTNGGRA